MRTSSLTWRVGAGAALLLAAACPIRADFVPLGDLPGGGFFSQAVGVSADGSVVVGQSRSAPGFEAFRWTQATGMVGLGDLPGGGSFTSAARGVSADGSVVVGESTSSTTSGSGLEAFRWTQATGMVGLGDLPGSFFFSRATDVSADGSVVVGLGTSASGQEAFRWTAATGLVGLGDLPGGIFGSIAFGVSADGSVVVGQGDSTLAELSPTVGEAFIWDTVNGMRNLRQVLLAQGDDLSGWTLRGAADVAVAPDGTITVVGLGINPAGQTEAFLARINGPGAVTPEPSILVLLGLGTACLLGYRCRRQHAARLP